MIFGSIKTYSVEKSETLDFGRSAQIISKLIQVKSSYFCRSRNSKRANMLDDKVKPHPYWLKIVETKRILAEV